MKLVNFALPVDFRAMPNFDAELTLIPCNRYNNAELTIKLRMFLDKIEVPKSTGHLLFPDSDGVIHKIVPWGAYFETWKRQFVRTAERAWHGKFWLKCPDKFARWDYEDKHMIYRPNIWCRFELQLVNPAEQVKQ